MDEVKEGESIAFEDKVKQVEPVMPIAKEIDPLEIFSPQGVKFNLKGKDYVLYPLPLRKLALFQKFGKEMAMLSTQEKEEIDTDKIVRSLAEIIVTILDAPKEDIEFFYENLTSPMLQWIFQTAIKLSSGLNSKNG
jgi:hypothetical protein